MSIEDINHMLSVSDENSLVIFVDSKNRDYIAHPTPASYVVNFDIPIRNVFGIEILDATIPATAYTIDELSCKIGFSQVFYCDGVVVYDATNPTSFAANISLLQHCPSFEKLFSAPNAANLFICTDKTNYDSMGVYDASLKLSSANGIFYVRQCPIHSSGLFTITVNGQTVQIEDEYVFDQYNAWEEDVSNWSFAVVDANLLCYYEYKYCLDPIAVTYIEQFASSPPYDLYICNSYLNITNGNYTSDYLVKTLQTIFTQNTRNQFLSAIQSVLKSGNVNIIPAFSDNPLNGESTITQLLAWTSQCIYPFIFDMAKTTARTTLGFSQYANTSAATLTSSALTDTISDVSPLITSTYGYTTFTFLANMRLFMSIMDTVSSQYLKSPGVLNIESARYLILRCPEIESHLLGSYANFKFSPGMGLFKLTSSNSMMNLRFDFVNIVRKPFHPIGKLSKLTIIFEQQDGSLYDFKGVDHVLLLSIKYYAPKNVMQVPRSILNPYYTPDLLEYQLRQYNDTSTRQKLKKYAIEDVIQEQRKYLGE
jgi:hypothetical protein